MLGRLCHPRPPGQLRWLGDGGAVSRASRVTLDERYGGWRLAGSCDALGGSVRGDQRLDRGRWLVTIVALASQHSDRPVSGIDLTPQDIDVTAGPPQVASGLSCVIAFVAIQITSQNVKIAIFVGEINLAFSFSNLVNDRPVAVTIYLTNDYRRKSCNSNLGPPGEKCLCHQPPILTFYGVLNNEMAIWD